MKSFVDCFGFAIAVLVGLLIVNALAGCASVPPCDRAFLYDLNHYGSDVHAGVCPPNEDFPL